MPLLAPIIAAAGAALSRLVMSNSGKWIAGALAAIGIQLAVTGATLLPFVDNVASAMNGIPGDIAEWMGVLQIDVYVSCYVSALLIVNARSAIRLRRKVA